jgi:hypothetical protein
VLSQRESQVAAAGTKDEGKKRAVRIVHPKKTLDFFQKFEMIVQ